MAPTPDAFRALARSSPWRFTTLHFTHRRADMEPVEAWLTRPGHLRVRLADGTEQVEEGVPYTTSVLTLAEGPLDRVPPGEGAKPGLAPRGPVQASDPDRAPQSVAPRLREDGLVAKRPEGFDIDYDDPMWQDYAWVAMLDPVELSAGVEVDDVRVWEWRGRTTWTATARAVEGYDPRCSCCALLWGEVSDAIDADGAGGSPAGGWPDVRSYPTAYEISLDVETGVVVDLTPVGVTRERLGFSNEIHQVGHGPTGPP